MKLLLQKVLFVLWLAVYPCHAFAAGACDGMVNIAEKEAISWVSLQQKFPVLKGLENLKDLQWVEGLAVPDSYDDARYSAVLSHIGHTVVKVELDTTALAHRLSGLTLLVELDEGALSFKRELDDYGLGRVHSRHAVQATEKLNWVLRYENIESQSADSNVPLEEFLNFAVSLRQSPGKAP